MTLLSKYFQDFDFVWQYNFLYFSFIILQKSINHCFIRTKAWWEMKVEHFKLKQVRWIFY